MLISLVCFISNVTFQLLSLSLFSLCAIKYLHIWMSNFPSAGSNRLWYVLELFCIAASVLFQQPPELRSDPGAAWQEEEMWDPKGIPYNTEPSKAWGTFSPRQLHNKCFLCLFLLLFIYFFLGRQITKGNKYWMMTTECIFGTC